MASDGKAEEVVAPKAQDADEEVFIMTIRFHIADGYREAFTNNYNKFFALKVRQFGDRYINGMVMWNDADPNLCRSIHIFANRATHKASAAPENKEFHALLADLPKEWFTAPNEYELGPLKATAGCFHTRE